MVVVITIKKPWTLLLPIILIFAFLTCLFLFSLNSRQDSPPHLAIMTHSSFSSEFGPGPHLKKEFEKKCSCQIQYKNAGEAGLIVKKLQLGAKADVVMGLDQFNIQGLSDSLSWKKVEVIKNWNRHVSPIKNFLPYDWSPMTFIYRKGEVPPPLSWSQLLSNNKYKISLQDPRSSTPGLQFLWWIYNLNDNSNDNDNSKSIDNKTVTTLADSPRSGDNDNSLLHKLKALHQTNYRISPSWSTAYGLFKSGKTNMVFSYLSSLLYHWNEEKRF